MADDSNGSGDVNALPVTESRVTQPPAPCGDSEESEQTHAGQKKGFHFGKAKEQKIRELEETISNLESQVKTEHEKWLRSRADLENFRKRKESERIEMIKLAKSDYIVELLPVVDSFDRALGPVNGNHNAADVIEGMQLIYKQFHDVLSRLGVQPIDAVNAKFNPDVHHAVVHEEHADLDDGTVIKEIQKGYTLGSRVIRPALVVVSKKPAAPKIELPGAQPSDLRPEGGVTAVI